MTRVAPTELDEVIAETDVARHDHLDADVAVAVGTKWECPHGAPQLDLADLVRRQMTSAHDHRVACVNRVGGQRDRRPQRDNGAKPKEQKKDDDPGGAADPTPPVGAALFR
jgi:hypothetical protein